MGLVPCLRIGFWLPNQLGLYPLKSRKLIRRFLSSSWDNLELDEVLTWNCERKAATDFEQTHAVKDRHTPDSSLLLTIAGFFTRWKVAIWGRFGWFRHSKCCILLLYCEGHIEVTCSSWATVNFQRRWDVTYIHCLPWLWKRESYFTRHCAYLDELRTSRKVKFLVTDLSVSPIEDVLSFHAIAKFNKLRLPQADEIYPSGSNTVHSVLLNGHERYLPGLEAQPRSNLEKKWYSIQVCGAFDWKKLWETTVSPIITFGLRNRNKFELNHTVLW